MYTRIALLLALLLTSACALPTPPPPKAEFIVSSGDATYWVQSGRSGFRIRRSPLILARASGRYYELYVEEVDSAFADAVFTGERVFRRDIATGDSAMIFEDTAVVRRAATFHAKHPRDPALDPDNDPPGEPAYSVDGETDILNVLGPYVALQHRLYIDGGEASVEDTVETLVDLRSGKGTDIVHVAADSSAREASGLRTGSERRWHNSTYDVLALTDQAKSAQTMVVRDPRGREWRIGALKSPFMQVFWLDNPKVDSRTRKALIRAFTEASAYGEPVQLVSHKRPAPAKPHTGSET
jgi:hypothetical protein